MDNELKKDFTRRLSQCNSGEMIVIIYDIFFAVIIADEEINLC